ncbi:MAG: M55 family metallopeptidase [Kiritimatiellae bacterium]|nr:M55 family metallopeptidase [Kiritimatiellia bacterium]
MRIYIFADLEGVCGVRDFEEWEKPGCYYHDMARELATGEVNAAVAGFFEAGAEYVLVSEGHGPGLIDILRLDPRAVLQRGPGTSRPAGIDANFDAIAFVGMHAKSRTPFSHLTHTTSSHVLEVSINGVAVGEFGQYALCANEYGARAIFAAGEQALAEEAQALVPGIETAAVKRGTVPGRGDECTFEQYRKHPLGALHLHPQKARALIRAGAKKAVERAGTEDFGIVRIEPPYTRICVFRGTDENPQRTFTLQKHDSSIVDLLRMPAERKPVESDEQLRDLLVD